jgi:Fic family protein
MRAEDFAPWQRLNVVATERGYRAFVPPPLPPDLRLTDELVASLSAADRALGELAGAGRSIPNPILLSQALMRREAVLSSRIEGTQSSLSELVLFEIAPQTGRTNVDVREVYNYVAALHHVIAPDRRLPVSLPLLKEAHEILFDDIQAGHTTPGEFRRSQNWIGRPGSLLGDATYVPPPPERLWDCLDALEKYIHADHRLPPLLAIGAIHYQFEAIHPFLDGNGRIGRLLVTLLFIEWGLLPAPLLDLSAYIEPRRSRYYDGLLRVSTDGDWTGWFMFFLEAVHVQARDAVDRTRRLQLLRDEYRSRVLTARSSALPGLLVDEIFRVPALTVPHAEEILGVTHRSAAQHVQRLVDEGILTPLEGRARPRLYVANEVIRVIEGVAGEE